MEGHSLTVNNFLKNIKDDVTEIRAAKNVKDAVAAVAKAKERNFWTL